MMKSTKVQRDPPIAVLSKQGNGGHSVGQWIFPRDIVLVILSCNLYFFEVKVDRSLIVSHHTHSCALIALCHVRSHAY